MKGGTRNMTNVGQVSVEARLGFRNLKKDIKSAKKEIEKFRKDAEKDIQINIQSKSAQKELQKLLNNIPQKQEINVLANTQSAQKAVDKIKSSLPNKLTTTIKADTGQAARQISGLQSDIRGLGAIRPTISLNTSSAMSAIDAMADKIQGLAKLSVGLGVAGGAIGATTYANKTQAVGAITAGTQVTGKGTASLQGAMSDYNARGYGDYNGFAQSFNALSAVMTDGVLKDGDVDKILKYINQTGAITAKSGLAPEDMAKAINSITRNFGVDTQTALDGLAYGVNNGLNFSGDFADTLNEYASVYKNSGYDFESMLGTLVSGKKAGVYNTDVVADTLKEAPLRVQALSKTATEYLGNKGVLDEIQTLLAKGDYSKINSILADTLGKESNIGTRDAMVSELYGGVGENIGYKGIAAITQGADVNLANDSTKLSDSMDDTNAKMIEFKSGLEDLKTSLIPLGVAVVDLANKYLPPVIAVTTKVVDWFTSLGTAGQSTVIALGGIIALGAPIALFASGLKTLTGVIANAIRNLGGGSGGMGGGTVVTGDANGKKGKKGGKLDKLKGLGSKIGGSKLLKKVPVIGAVAGGLGIAGAAMSGDMQGVAQQTGGLAGGMAGAMGGAALGSMILPGVGTAIGGLAGGVIGGIGGEKIVKEWETIKSKTSEIWSSIKTGASNVASDMSTKGTAMATNVRTGIANNIDNVRSTASSVWSTVSSAASTIATKMPAVGALMPANLAIGLLGQKGTLYSNASSVWSVIKTATTGVANGMTSIGRHIVEGVWSGMSNAKDWLMKKAKSLFNSLPEWARDVLDIHSPSRVFASIGGYVTKGIGVGLEAEQGFALNKMSNLTDLLTKEGSNMSIAPSVDVQGNYSLSHAALAQQTTGRGDVINYNVDIHYSPDMTQKIKAQITRDLKQIGYIR